MCCDLFGVLCVNVLCSRSCLMCVVRCVFVVLVLSLYVVGCPCLLYGAWCLLVVAV